MGSTSAPTVKQIAATLGHFLRQGQLAALWVKEPHTGGEDVRQLTGYFTDPMRLAREALRHDGRSAGLYVSMNPIDQEQLSAPASKWLNAQASRYVKPPRNEHIVRRRLLLIDCDPKRKGTVASTDQEKAFAWEKAKAVGRYLRDQDWPYPAILDTGNGYGLVYRINLPADDVAIVRGVLAALASQFDDEHVTIDRKVSPAKQLMRLPGTMNCKGKNTTKRPWRRSRLVRVPKDALHIVATKLLKVVSKKGFTHGTDKAAPPPSVGVDAVLLDHARNYLEAMPEAVEGQGGGLQALVAARAIVVGFDLPPDSNEAWQLLLHYNKTRCHPPWRPDQYEDLRRKLRDVDERARQDGQDRAGLRLGGRHRHFQPLPGPDFPIAVPDYGLLDAKTIDCVLKSPLVPHAYGLRMLGVWQQKRPDVLVPDVLVKLTHWGANAPRNWRPQYRKGIRHVNHQLRVHPKQCREGCLLHESDLRHKHCGFPYASCGILDEVTEDGVIDCESDLYRSYRKRQIYYGYWPALIFGMSKPVGLTAQQVCLLTAVTRELTRVAYRPVGQKANGKTTYAKGPSDRPDRAEVYSEGKVAPSGTGRDRIICPLLDKDEEYVAFCGNLRRSRGKGYRFVHWFALLGVASPNWDDVGELLRDLAVLAERFDLVVVARHHDLGHWYTLEQMQEMLQTPSGLERLDRMMIRIYAPADFLVRWRYTFAQRLGFGWIPGGEPRPYVADSNEDRASEVLRKFLHSTGLTEAALAKKLGVSRETVSRNLNRPRCSASFWKKLQATMARM